MFKRLRRRKARHSASSRLDVCTSCHADYVHPVESSESGDKHWLMLLRCGECRVEREVTVANPVAQRFGDHLAAAEREIQRAVVRLDAERMAAEVELFAAVLEHDLIAPLPTSAADWPDVIRGRDLNSGLPKTIVLTNRHSRTSRPS